MSATVIDCRVVSASYGYSGILTSSKQSIYSMVDIPNSRYSHRLSSRDHAGPGCSFPKG